jgi:hypothetical protein
MALVIGDLLEGRDRPLAVRPTDRLSAAIEQMRRHDFTQLPVTSEDDKLVGLVTSDSILSALEAFGLQAAKLTVADAMRKPRSFDPDADVGELLNALRDDYAALVIDSEGTLKGIITGFDASEYFRRRSEDIMLVEDIESNIKEHVLAAFEDDSGKRDDSKLAELIGKVADPNKSIKGRITTALRLYLQRAQLTDLDAEMLEQVLKETSSSAKAPTFDDLTLNAYIDLILHHSVWGKYSDVFGIEAEALRRLLESVRDTRNVLAHFRGDISATDRDKLRFCAAWLERHPPRRTEIPAPIAVVELPAESSQATDAEIVPVDDQVAPGESRYAKLAVWLQRLPSSQASCSLTFNQVEEVLGAQLPGSARAHRSWWANDSVSHPQSTRWLEVGWRVANVNLAEEIAVFSRIEEREAAYIGFFSKLLAKVEREKKFPLRASSPSGVNWHTFTRLPETGWMLGIVVCSFARGDRIRVEFYIDSKDKDVNKEVFDKIMATRSTIEENFGGQLSWERLDDKRASRVAVYRPGAITWPPSELNELVDWAANSLTRLYNALRTPVREASPGAATSAADIQF